MFRICLFIVSVCQIINNGDFVIVNFFSDRVFLSIQWWLWTHCFIQAGFQFKILLSSKCFTYRCVPQWLASYYNFLFVWFFKRGFLYVTLDVQHSILRPHRVRLRELSSRKSRGVRAVRGETGNAIVGAWHGRADTISQQLWLPVQGLQETGPLSRQSWYPLTPR